MWVFASAQIWSLAVPLLTGDTLSIESHVQSDLALMLFSINGDGQLQHVVSVPKPSTTRCWRYPETADDTVPLIGSAGAECLNPLKPCRWTYPCWPRHCRPVADEQTNPTGRPSAMDAFATVPARLTAWSKSPRAMRATSLRSASRGFSIRCNRRVAGFKFRIPEGGNSTAEKWCAGQE